MPIRHRLLQNSNFDAEPYEAVLNVMFPNTKLRMLGSGCYATAYQHPVYADRVVKVLRYRDRGYTAFIRATIRLQDRGKPCAWLPRVYEATMFHVRSPYAPNASRRDYDRVLVLVLDKLVGANDSDLLTPHQQRVIDGLRENRIWDVPSGELLRRFGELSPGAKMFRQLRRAENVIRYAMNKARATCDLHWGNVMFKPDSGQLVFTDPLA